MAEVEEDNTLSEEDIDSIRGILYDVLLESLPDKYARAALGMSAADER